MSSTAVSNVKANWVDIPIPNEGSQMEGYLARPDKTGTFPPVLVLMEIFGVNSHIREVTERIAAEGYTALAINYYHRTAPGLELGYTDADMQEGYQHMEKTTEKGLREDVQAAMDFLKQQDFVDDNKGVATIGFCFGGHVVYLVANNPAIKATASFYGAGVATQRPGGGEPTVAMTSEITGEVLCLFGGQDPLISAEDNQTVETALKEHNVDHTVVRYPEATHGFFCNARDSYNETAAKDAWEKVKTLFAKHLQV